jgi:hypothetical protein
MSDPINVIAKALVPSCFGAFEDQTTDEEGKRLHPPFTPSAKARKTARAVLAALEEAGYRIVGREPTDEMKDAGWVIPKSVYYAWFDMWDAATRYGGK